MIDYREIAAQLRKEAIRLRQRADDDRAAESDVPPGEERLGVRNPQERADEANSLANKLDEAAAALDQLAQDQDREGLSAEPDDSP